MTPCGKEWICDVKPAPGMATCGYRTRNENRVFCGQWQKHWSSLVVRETFLDVTCSLFYLMAQKVCGIRRASHIFKKSGSRYNHTLSIYVLYRHSFATNVSNYFSKTVLVIIKVLEHRFVNTDDVFKLIPELTPLEQQLKHLTHVQICFVVIDVPNVYLVLKECWQGCPFNTLNPGGALCSGKGLFDAKPLPKSIQSYQHIEAETKWLPISWRHFQMHFLEWKYINFD